MWKKITEQVNINDKLNHMVNILSNKVKLLEGDKNELTAKVIRLEKYVNLKIEKEKSKKEKEKNRENYKDKEKKKEKKEKEKTKKIK